ncbi:MAG: 50S ribosomal protein L11 [Holosporales bacterium]|jgi:large subunit ribosomal protein L11|nr:50S ribosomal protein L11 [Holosporales bacterium]
MAKKIIGYIKLQIPAGKANPSPPIGPALAQKGLNIMEFCKAFNAKTQQMEPGMPVPVVITAYADKSFSYIMKSPPVSYFIKKAAGIQSGSGKTGISNPVAKITMEQVRDIARDKIQDMNTNNIEAACQMIVGSARSIGVEIVEE